MNRRTSWIVPVLMSPMLAMCGHTPKPRGPIEPPWHPPTTMLLPYAAPDGSLTRAQMEAGLKRDFDKVDANHNGCLDEDEVRAINEQRWKQDASTASPLIDFKHNGCVDFDEFAATARSLFDQLDKKGTGKLTAAQLKPVTAKPAAGSSSDTTHHHHSGSGQGGGTQPDQQ